MTITKLKIQTLKNGQLMTKERLKNGALITKNLIIERILCHWLHLINGQMSFIYKGFRRKIGV